MKRLKFLLPLFMLLLGIGLVFTQSAFKKTEKFSTLKFRYTGSDASGLHTVGNWQDVSTQPNPEGCDPGEEIPCLIEFDTSQWSSLSAYLSANSTLQDMVDSGAIQSYKDETIE